MSNPVTSVKIGKYRLTAVGLITAIILLLAIVCAGVFGAMHLINGQDEARPVISANNSAPTASPTPTAAPVIAANAGRAGGRRQCGAGGH